MGLFGNKMPPMPTAATPTPPSIADTGVQDAASKQRAGGGVSITILTGPGGLEGPATTTAKSLTGA